MPKKQYTQEELRQRHYDDIRNELEHFKTEKERVRSIVGQIGAVPRQSVKIFNIVFLIVVIACIPLSLLTHGILQHLILELAIAAISLKLIWIMHTQTRVNHFQLWVLTSLEWRVNEMMRLLQDMDEKIENICSATGAPIPEDTYEPKSPPPDMEKAE